MKIEEQVLSIEQMKHLQELGVDTSDATFAWFMSPNTNQWKIKVKDNFAHELLLMFSPERYIPTYTTGDLLEKLPKIVNGDSLLIEFYASDLGYGNWESCELYEITAQQNFKDKPLKDALYNLLCWLEENHKELIE